MHVIQGPLKFGSPDPALRRIGEPVEVIRTALANPKDHALNAHPRATGGVDIQNSVTCVVTGDFLTDVNQSVPVPRPPGVEFVGGLKSRGVKQPCIVVGDCRLDEQGQLNQSPVPAAVFQRGGNKTPLQIALGQKTVHRKEDVASGKIAVAVRREGIRSRATGHPDDNRLVVVAQNRHFDLDFILCFVENVRDLRRGIYIGLPVTRVDRMFNLHRLRVQ